MNPVFIALVLLGGVALWVLLNPLFRLVGELFERLMTDVKNQMSDNNESEDKQK